MRHFIILLAIFLSSCDYGAFSSDKRQIMAKDAIRSQLPRRSHDFDITSFKEDTLYNPPDLNLKEAIIYTLNYHYTDSAGNVQARKAIVLFTPDGRSILNPLNHP